MKFLLSILLSACSFSYVSAQVACNSWTKLNNRFAAVTVGDLDVTGNKVTVEALFNMTGPSVNIVSKHWGGFDVNYLLRPVRAEIATVDNGLVVTDAGAFPCDDSMELNKTYHVALVYNGSTLRFYRNGVLVSEVPATGDLLTNDWNTAIGEHAPVVTPFVNGVPNSDYQNQNEGQGFYDESFRGFINEVRIWNIARTQDEIRNYMNTPLPEPATQTGLLGYWVFDSLQNRQGNSAYDGFLEGQAEIGQTNTTCNGIPDSCDVYVPLKYITFNSTEPGAGRITLNWNTESESDIQEYEVLRSLSPSFNQFTIVGRVNALNGAGNNAYTFTDDDLSGITNCFYKLRIKHRTGPVSHSAVINAKAFPAPVVPVSFLATLYPNPSNDGRFTLRFYNDVASEGYLMVYNCNGVLVQSSKINVTSGINNIPVDLTIYQKGSYYVKLLTSNTSIIKSALKF